MDWAFGDRAPERSVDIFYGDDSAGGYLQVDEFVESVDENRAGISPRRGRNMHAVAHPEAGIGVMIIVKIQVYSTVLLGKFHGG